MLHGADPIPAGFARRAHPHVAGHEEEANPDPAGFSFEIRLGAPELRANPAAEPLQHSVHRVRSALDRPRGHLPSCDMPWFCDSFLCSGNIGGRWRVVIGGCSGWVSLRCDAECGTDGISIPSGRFFPGGEIYLRRTALALLNTSIHKHIHIYIYICIRTDLCVYTCDIRPQTKPVPTYIMNAAFASPGTVTGVIS